MALHLLCRHHFLRSATVRGASPQGGCDILCLGANRGYHRDRCHGTSMAWTLCIWFSRHSYFGLCLPGISFLQALSSLVARCSHQRRRLSALGRSLSAWPNDGCLGPRA